MGKRRATTEGTERGKVPALRFPYYTDRWEIRKNADLLERISNPVNVKQNQLYVQIGIRSHGKGIFHKEPVTGKKLGNKRVFWLQSNLLVFNIVFAWEQAVALTTESEMGLIASHRFPMYRAYSGKSNAQYLLHFYLTPKGKHLLGIASPGGAGRNKTLGQKEFDKLRFFVPRSEEQTRIAAFLSAADRRIALLERKREALERYKKGVMQRLFTVNSSENGRGRPALRFKDDRGREFPDWEEKRLGEVAQFSKGKGISKTDIALEGKTNCIRYGELYTDYNETISVVKSKTDIDKSELVLSQENDVLIPASGETQVDIAKASCLMLPGVAIGGDLNIIRSQQNGIFMSYYLNNAKKYEIARLAQGNSVVHLYSSQLKSVAIYLPSLPEQQKIAAFLSSLDRAIEKLGEQIAASKEWKQGLLQKMFV